MSDDTRYEGFHDDTDCRWITGWVWDPAEPDRAVEVEIHADDVPFARVAADGLRADLVTAGKGNGRHGFKYPVPFWLKDRRPHHIRVTVAGTDFELAGTGKSIECEGTLLVAIREAKERARQPSAAAAMPLAVFAPNVGGLSETFIRRHMAALLPSRTAVVTGTLSGPHGGHWSVDGPMLVLDRHPPERWEHSFRELLARHDVRVVLGEYLNESLAWLPAVKRTGRRFVAHAHGYDISQLLRDPTWRAAYRHYEEADGVVTMSRYAKARLVELGLSASRIHVIPYGVDVPDEPPRPSSAEAGEIRCVAVGRMVAKKGPLLTLDAFARAAAAVPNLRLDFVGEGPILHVARQLVSELELGSRITLHGAQSPQVVKRLLGAADVFLQHSITDPDTGDEEGLPVSILEAMAHGLPVVSTNHSGIPEAVVDGTTGYLVEPRDTVAMSDRIVALVRDPDLGRRLGEAGWRRARELFAWERERRELLAVLGLDDPGTR